VLTVSIAGLVFIPMLIEARRAAANELTKLQRGGVEARGDVYPVMRLAYPAVFASMIAEQIARSGSLGAVVWVGLGLFAAAKALKWWAILTLGPSWTFRVIVIPRDPLVASGPYRLMRHPNYVAVAGEIVSTALMTGARVTGPIGLVFFGLLMARRIAVEDRALSGR
jgi:methyltransferase